MRLHRPLDGRVQMRTDIGIWVASLPGLLEMKIINPFEGRFSLL